MTTLAPVFPGPLFIGLLLGFFVFFVGNLAVGPTIKKTEQDYLILSHKVAQAYLVAEKSSNKFIKEEIIHHALGEARNHPQVLSASIRTNSNQILGLSQKESGSPFIHTKDFEYPVMDGRGKPLAFIQLKLSPDAMNVIGPLQRKIVFLSFLGFLFGVFVPIFFTKKPSSMAPEIIEAVKQVGAGNLEVSLPPSVSNQHTDFVDAFNIMVDALHERDRMKHSLGRIMDPKIAEALIKEDPKLGGLKRQATILFCDIRNYTSICEELTGDELQEFLNEYWKGTVEIIMEQEGTIDKFHGDGVCVVFGAPQLHEDDPLRAVRTAWRLVGNVAAINERRQAQRKMPIQIGIGIHLGEVMAGHIGSERRMDYTVVGDVVNVAARIEELNKKFGTQILISDNVYEKVESNVRVKTLTLAHLRGHKRPILVHTLKEFHDRTDEIKNEKAA